MVGIQGSDCKAQGYRVPGCRARDCKAPAVHIVVAEVEEAVSNRPVAAVVRIAAAVRTEVAVRTAAVEVQATGNHRFEDKAVEHSVGGLAEEVQGMASSVAGLGQHQRHRQQDVLREACRRG